MAMSRRILTAREQYALLAPWLPHKLNPDPSDPYSEHHLPDRPRISWEPEEYHQERLPDERWPRGQKPTTLYRGVHIDLDHPAFADHPNVQGMKDILYGRQGGGTEGLFGEPQTPGNLYPHPRSPEGKQLSQHVLDFVEDVGHNRDRYFEPFTEQNERSRVPFTKVHDNPNPTWLGRHWTTEPEIADDFAKQPNEPGVTGPKRGLSVMLQADWDGRGEDLARSNVGGDWGDESEINLVPGASLNVKGVHIRHPHTLPRPGGGGDWHNILHEPETRTAGRADNMQSVILYTKPNCGACNMTKKRLDHHEIPHQVVDVTTDPDAYDHVTKNLGYTSAPVVDAGSGNHWSGFRPDRIQGLLGVHR